MSILKNFLKTDTFLAIAMFLQYALLGAGIGASVGFVGWGLAISQGLALAQLIALKRT